MSDWISIVGLAFGICVGLWIVTKSAFALVEIVLKVKAYEQFEKDFKDVVAYSQPSWREIKEVAGSRCLSKKKLLQIIRNYYRDLLAGLIGEQEKHRSLISVELLK